MARRVGEIQAQDAEEGKGVPRGRPRHSSGIAILAESYFDPGMNRPTADAIRVAPARLERWAHAVARSAGMPEDRAGLLARLLVENDLRGVFSHGTSQLLRYIREIARGDLNPAPVVRRVSESPTSVLLDGDGGLGYFPAYEGTLLAIEKAREHGMAAMVSRNHGHIGAAGIYTRLPLQHDLIAFATSGVQLDLKPGNPVYSAAGQSPISFSAPGLEEPPLVLDCGVTHGLQGHAPPHRDRIAELEPGVALRAIGFGTICQAWGGLLSGLPVDGARANRIHAAANQGALLFVCRISLFLDPETFKREIDDYMRRVRENLVPIPNTEGAFLPGNPEADRERTWRREGIPLGERHRHRLETVAAETGVGVPWDKAGKPRAARTGGEQT